eukprot:2854332-Amphidinium_carterae.1
MAGSGTPLAMVFFGANNIGFHHCPHWHKKRREFGLPASAQQAPACVRLDGFLPAPLPTHEPALVFRQNVDTVWTDGFGRHSSKPLF